MRLVYPVLMLGAWAASARAQTPAAPPVDSNATPPAATPAPAPAAASAPSQPATEASGIGFRNGFSASLGEEFATVGSTSFSAALYGIDWRIGATINPAISVYLHSHLSFGKGDFSGGGSGYTGNFASAIVGEYQLPMRIFFAGGAGYGVLNNPSGPMVEVRAGYYPFAHAGSDTARRFNVAVDGRWYFVSSGGSSLTMTHIALSIGYDRF